MNCTYCNKKTEWVSNEKIYGRRYGKSYMMWLCEPCDAYVGCHNNSKKALGTLANKQLRELRKESKNLFITKYLHRWDCANHIKDSMYKRLADELKIKVSECHFGLFDETMCKKVIELLSSN